MICLSKINQAAKGGLISLSRIDQAGKGCLIGLNRIDQAEKAAWFAWAGFFVLLRKSGDQAN